MPAFVLALVGLSLLCQYLLLRAPPAALAAGQGEVPAGSWLFPLDWLLDWLGAHGFAATWPLFEQFLAVLAAAWFLGLLWRDLAAFCGWRWASALTLLVAVNPAFLQLPLAGGTPAFALLGFYGLCRTLRRLQGSVEAFTYLRISGWLCLMLGIDLSTALLAVAVAPWLLLVAPARLRRAPFALYLVCYMPFVFALLAWAYLQSSLSGGSWPSLGALHDGSRLPELFAARPFALGWPPALRWAAAAALCFPVLLLAGRHRGAFFVRGVVVALGTVVTAAIAAGWLGLRVDIYLFLLWVPVALLLRGLWPEHGWLAVALLGLGLLGGALVCPGASLALSGQAGGAAAAAQAG